ncbi:hypothetical protein DLAC_01392 [Tieghemostelium lacteum]|uniref:Uncharacterized protein n=1 Tax=Tieghemostelium lacteum TaxID=361077 RepID=A0A152A8J0_TIELA|nr:hypothetical protein DLAC_01392 [Tieghemostelium lacteum]|eukprot:KYR02546.1 hypothetical protein DLAC_01392 [Tieghemostelium lacteum]
MKICPDEMKKAFPTPESLKLFIGVPRRDGVPIDKIGMIEGKLPSNIQIIVSGDHQYHSINPSAKRVIKLLLEDGHFRVHHDQDSYQ